MFLLIKGKYYSNGALITQVAIPFVYLTLHMDRRCAPQKIVAQIKIAYSFLYN